MGIAKKGLIGSFIAMGITGCATPVYNAIPTQKNVSKPPIDSVNTVSVGEKMLV